MSDAIYIAASSRELLRVEQAVAYARSIGLSVPCDWTVPIRERAAEGKTDSDLTPHERQRVALGALAAVRGCTVVALLSTSESEMRGEMVAAFMARRTIIASRETCTRVRLFDVLATYECASDRLALDLAAQIARRL